MIRKDSYRVSVPRNVRLFLSEYPPAILIRGPLGCAVIGVPSSRVFSVYKGWLKWSRITGRTRRSEMLSRRLNNGFSRFFYNLFEDLSAPSVATVRLIGRGYKVSWSPRTRKIFVRIGYSGKKAIPLPSSVNISVTNRYNFSLWSIHPGQLRVLSLGIRSLREPSPYTAKGVLLNNEVIDKKEGKKSQY